MENEQFWFFFRVPPFPFLHNFSFTQFLLPPSVFPVFSFFQLSKLIILLFFSCLGSLLQLWKDYWKPVGGWKLFLFCFSSTTFSTSLQISPPSFINPTSEICPAQHSSVPKSWLRIVFTPWNFCTCFKNYKHPIKCQNKLPKPTNILHQSSTFAIKVESIKFAQNFQ